MTRSSQHRDRNRSTAAPAAELPAGPLPSSTGEIELVVERANPELVTLLVNGVPSSHHHLTDPNHLEFEYMQHLAAVLRHTLPPKSNVVHLGGGACTMARWAHHFDPSSRHLVIELDTTLAEAVRNWFELPRSPALRIRAAEAGAEISRMGEARNDVVIRDVFASETTPAHLLTAQFASEVQRTLRPEGIYLVNCADRPALTVVRDELATLLTVFPKVWAIAEPSQLRGRRYGNFVLVATSGAKPFPQAQLATDLNRLPVPARIVGGAELQALAAGGRILSDAAEQG